MRGAISIDNLYIDEHIVYGKGLIDSYLGESQKARDPRIILTETAALAVKQHIKYNAYFLSSEKVMVVELRQA